MQVHFEQDAYVKLLCEVNDTHVLWKKGKLFRLKIVLVCEISFIAKASYYFPFYFYN